MDLVIDRTSAPPLYDRVEEQSMGYRKTLSWIEVAGMEKDERTVR